MSIKADMDLLMSKLEKELEEIGVEKIKIVLKNGDIKLFNYDEKAEYVGNALLTGLAYLRNKRVFCP